MNIVYFLQQLYNQGGLERTLTDKADYLVAQGHSVMFVTFEHHDSVAYPLPAAARHVDLDSHVYSLYVLPAWRRISGFLHLKRQFRQRLAAAMESFRPDVIVATIPYTENFLCDLRRVCPHVPLVVEAHLAYGPYYVGEGKLENLMRRFYRPMDVLRRSQLLIALTQGDARTWQQLGIRNVRVIPNPLPASFPPSSPLSSGGLSERRIICVGRLDRQKRMDRLIDAFALLAPHHPEYVLDIFGDGPERDALGRQIDALGLQHAVRLRGVTNQIADEYHRSQFLVLSSDYEGFGLVLIEAMACGLPVVATDCPCGPSDIVADGTTGLLARMDVRDLADKMEWMMTHDAERNEMGQRAREAAARYRREVVMPQWEQAYLSVIP